MSLSPHTQTLARAFSLLARFLSPVGGETHTSHRGTTDDTERNTHLTQEYTPHTGIHTSHIATPPAAVKFPKTVLPLACVSIQDVRVRGERDQ
jgi:hypothetical protein